MKLSEAMMLGSVTVKMVPGDINSCALGAAANAVGIPPIPEAFGRDMTRIKAIWKRWPWLQSQQCTCGDVFCTGISSFCIAYKFNRHVCYGTMTFEALVDWVRSVEPACGECCQFECACVKQAEAGPSVSLRDDKYFDEVAHGDVHTAGVALAVRVPGLPGDLYSKAGCGGESVAAGPVRGVPEVRLEHAYP